MGIFQFLPCLHGWSADPWCHFRSWWTRPWDRLRWQRLAKTSSRRMTKGIPERKRNLWLDFWVSLACCDSAESGSNFGPKFRTANVIRCRESAILWRELVGRSQSFGIRLLDHDGSWTELKDGARRDQRVHYRKCDCRKVSWGLCH